MNKNQIIGIVSASVLALLLITNPSKETHKEAVKTIMTEAMDKKLAEEKSKMKDNPFAGMMAGLGTMAVNVAVDGMIDRDNYLLFSLTKAKAEGKTKVIGFGVLGFVHVSDKVSQAFMDKGLNNL